MKITYLEHSGFAVEWDACIWIFDYYRGQIPQWDRRKPLVVFASHAHKDHFVPEIFLKFGDFQEVNYVLSSDIRKKIRKMQIPDLEEKKIHYMSPGEQWEAVPGGLESMKVTALDSTDCGVAFLTEYCGRKIFHAGDLNCWVWEGDTKAEQKSMTARYQKEIGKLSKEKIDCAFLPLDYRLLEAYDMGIRYFLDHVTVSHIFPMHLWGRYSVAEKFRDSLEDPVKQEKIVSVEYPGQQWEYGRCNVTATDAEFRERTFLTEQ